MGGAGLREHRISVAAGRRAELVMALLMNFLLYHCAACTIVGMFYKTGFSEHFLRMGCLLLPLFFMAFLRHRVNNFFLFFPLHVLPLLFSLLAGQDLAEKFVLAGFTILMLVISISMRTTERWKVQEYPSLGMGVVLLICHFLGYYMKNMVLVGWSYYELFFYIILFFLHRNLKNMSDFIDVNKKTVNFPAGQMTVINRILLVLFLAVLGMAMYLVPKLHLETILLPALKAMLSAIAWLFSIFHFSKASERVESMSQGVDQRFNIKDLGEAETGLFWMLLEKILMAAVILLIAAAVVGGIAYLLYRLYKGFYDVKKENADEKEFLVGDLQWFPRGLFGKKETVPKEQGTSQRIRRLYKRYVKKSFGKKETVPAALTPKELLYVIGEKKGESGLDSSSGRKVRDIYEHARYASQECMPEELEELKALLSGRQRDNMNGSC